MVCVAPSARSIPGILDLYPTEEQNYALFVTSLETNEPKISYLEPVAEPPIVQIVPDITFQLFHFSPEQEPFIKMVQPEVIFSSDLTENELDRIEASILSGGDPVQSRDELIVLGQEPYFT
jgi:hypothetical protein